VVAGDPFGVHQRESFWNTTQKPHLITMTATPIPRTIAHTVLSDRDMSRLVEIPSKRKISPQKFQSINAISVYMD
jgi:RecG-like helicase